MPAAISSVFRTGIALAGAGVIAVSPLAPVQDAHIRSVTIPAIELMDLTPPAIGALPYQVALNTIGNVLALAPILIGSTEQCSVCLGPKEPPSDFATPFTGWGLIGTAVGLVSSPLALVKSLTDGNGFAEAVGAAILALQVPIQNTWTLLNDPLVTRADDGGFQLSATVDRAVKALRDSLVGLYDIGAQALNSLLIGQTLPQPTGPTSILGAAIAATSVFAAALAGTGDFKAAFDDARKLFEQGVNNAVTNFVNVVQESRARVYNDLLSGPSVTKRPIPIAAATPVAAGPARAAASGGPVTKVTASVKAVPAATAADENGGGSDKSADDQGSASASKANKGGAATSRAHRSR